MADFFKGRKRIDL